MKNKMLDPNFLLDSKIAEISFKVKAMGYLLQVRQEDSMPLDIDEINEGIGQILRDLGGELKEIAIGIDEEAVKRAQKKHQD